MKKLLFASLALVFVLVAFLPAQAYAGEKEKDKLVPVSCILTLAVTDPGTLSVKGNIVETSGEKTSGKLDCNLKAMDGDFASVHSSKITVDPITGSFNGSLKGTFTLRKNKGKVLKGEMSADISGYVIGLAPSPPFPPGTPVHRVIDNGKWEIDGKIEAKGTFAVTLEGIVGLPASMGGLAGGGTMEGMAEKD